jgi:hypothetical protein
LAPKTQQSYIRTVKDFAAFLGWSPDTANFVDVRRLMPTLRHDPETGIYRPK